MFFEDEKDDIIIDSNADIQISDDGTVSWDDILNDDNGDDDLISLKEQSSAASSQEVNTSQISDNSLLGLEDELQYVDDDDDIDDEQLNKILNDETEKTPSRQQAFDAFGSADEVEADDKSVYQEEFDIDAQLANAAASSNSTQKVLKDRTPRSEIKIGANAKKSNTPILLAILVAVLVACGVYTFNGNSKNTVSHGDLNLNESQNAVQEQLNNTTQDDISNRTEEGIPVVNEEQIDDIKPILEENAADKEVVALTQTGRQDPFVPLSKYTALVAEKKEAPVVIPKKTSYVNQYFDKPPVAVKDQDVVYIRHDTIKQIGDFEVSGIMYNTKNSAAIIKYNGNAFFVKVGDSIGSFTVSDIQRNYLVLSAGKYSLRVSVSEEINSAARHTVPDGVIGSGRTRHYPDKQAKKENRDDEEIQAEEMRVNNHTDRFDPSNEIQIREKRK